MVKQAEQLQQHLLSSGIPSDFSTIPMHQTIPGDVLHEIDQFIEIFEQVTSRTAWLSTALRETPEVAQIHHCETCFFSAWDIHLPPEHPHQWQLIEFNDNGSGFLFAGLINQVYYDLFLSKTTEASATEANDSVKPPLCYAQLCSQIQTMIAAESHAFFGQQPDGLLLILDDSESLQTGRFRHEHQLLAKIAQGQGWHTAIDSPESLYWDGRQLLLLEGSGEQTAGKPVAFIINRSTDFLWQDAIFTPLNQAYKSGSVYVAPNPFSYATKSDKRLLEYLSRPDWDNELGIKKNERAMLSSHVPATYLLTEANLSQLAEQKADFVFKPTHGHASLGVLNSHEIGKHRLQRLLAKGHPYIAQQIAEKSQLLPETNHPLWSDLRVWAYKGRRFLISGRASSRKERLDLHPPGGWVPTFESL
ncbi:hypothetical protein MD588_20495 [Photobacterium sp. SDRW27]|uniref:hypothetical protein n=1 Tax=Photobacterium obscurum TaxID=2829490 RepID=UPI002242D78F|nr:hypothetical protein [Photobacterium obscurum]MCW8331179.1 hypothetical protein [Photobacterium obscurum]